MYAIKRRTFAAAKHPKGSEERAALNKDPLTSEYYPSYRYILFRYGPDGSVSWTNIYATKGEAEKTMRRLLEAEGPIQAAHYPERPR